MCVHTHFIKLWCILELNKFIKKLDKKASEVHKAGGFKCKPRILSTPSTLLPPPNAPNWAVGNSYWQLPTTTVATPMAVSTTTATTTSMAMTPPDISMSTVMTTSRVTNTEITPTQPAGVVGTVVPSSITNADTPVSSRIMSQRQLDMGTLGMIHVCICAF